MERRFTGTTSVGTFTPRRPLSYRQVGFYPIDQGSAHGVTCLEWQTQNTAKATTETECEPLALDASDAGLDKCNSPADHIIQMPALHSLA